MNEDVVLHGDFAQFRSTSRCTACQDGDHKCVNQENDESCMICAGAGRKCVFSRTVTVSGPKGVFPWLSLLKQDENQSIIQLGDLNINRLIEDGSLSLTAPSRTVTDLSSATTVTLPRHASPESSTPQSVLAAFPRDQSHPAGDKPTLATNRDDFIHQSNKRSHDGALVFQRIAPKPTDPATSATIVLRRHSRSSSEPSLLRAGLDPISRDLIRHDNIPSLGDQAREASSNLAVVNVTQWLSMVDVNSAGTPIAERGTVDDQDTGDDVLYAASDPASIDERDELFEAIRSVPDSRYSPQNAAPWSDPIYYPSQADNPGQPQTSNAAMMRFAQRASDIETASRASSWGTVHQTLSESGRDRIFGPIGLLSRMHISGDEVARYVQESQQSSSTIARRRIASQPRRKTSLVFKTSQADSPLPIYASPVAATVPLTLTGDEDMDSDGMADDTDVPFDLTLLKDLPIPTLPGFMNKLRNGNPRLPQFLSERIGHEQVQRYRKLVELKVKHAQAVDQGNCPSGPNCSIRGQQSAISGFDGEKEETEAPVDGTVSAAQYPSCFPLPPVKRLPATFECPFCFQAKLFQKPSDWTKHVYEDFQPFICTFQECPDPKSFKRKADWVRHENERHRQLEWWICSQKGCSHKCYRRDNFVQHLVREHRMPEPKARASKPNRPAVRGPAKMKRESLKDLGDGTSEDGVLKMVEACHVVTTKTAHDEPCRFCGNVCTSWKKLTVHLAKHLEQIGAPVLALVMQKDVTPDTYFEPNKPQTPSHQPNASQATTPNMTTYATRNGSFHDRESTWQIEPPPRREITSLVPIEPRQAPIAFEAVNSAAIRQSERQYPAIERPQRRASTSAEYPRDPSYTTITPRRLSPKRFSFTNGPPVFGTRPDQPILAPKPFRCTVTGCHREQGFTTRNDLERHMKSLHNILPAGNDPRRFRCAGPNCNKKDKIWPRLDNFRKHITRIHPDEDVDDLVVKSTIPFNGTETDAEPEVVPRPTPTRNEVEGSIVLA